MTNPTLPVDAKDLNVLVPADRTVLFGSPAVAYKVPGDMPMDIYLLAQAAMVNEDEIQGTNQLHQALTQLFGWFIPADDTEARRTLDRDLRAQGVRTMMRLLNATYADDEDAEAAADEAGEDSSPVTPAMMTTSSSAPASPIQTPVTSQSAT